MNSVPSSLSYHQLKVISEEDEDSRDSLIDSKDEQFASCCIRANISDACRGFCSLNILLMGVDGTSPDDCEDEFPAIAASMADGRNHQPCCLKMGVPEVCTDLCKGEYNKKTDNIKTIFNCREHMPRTLACIAAGVGEDFLLTISRKVSLIFFYFSETLPPKPFGFSVTALNSTSLSVSWFSSSPSDKLTQKYMINITYIQ